MCVFMCLCGVCLGLSVQLFCVNILCECVRYVYVVGFVVCNYIYVSLVCFVFVTCLIGFGACELCFVYVCVLCLCLCMCVCEYMLFCLLSLCGIARVWCVCVVCDVVCVYECMSVFVCVYE